jgi:monoamine oxidase
MLRLSAATAGAAALAPIPDWSAYAKEPERHKGPVSKTVAIVGGGVAGLAAAYRLQAGRRIAGASNRWGGRMYTQYDLYKGAFCELGDEFVYTDHEDLQNLGKELGVENAEPHHRRR